jgi:hypothetical protein
MSKREPEPERWKFVARVCRSMCAQRSRIPVRVLRRSKSLRTALPLSAFAVAVGEQGMSGSAEPGAVIVHVRVERLQRLDWDGDVARVHGLDREGVDVGRRSAAARSWRRMLLRRPQRVSPRGAARGVGVWAPLTGGGYSAGSGRTPLCVTTTSIEHRCANPGIGSALT